MAEHLPRFSAAVEIADDTATVIAVGELDLATTPVLASVLADTFRHEDVCNLDVDLADVTFADSTALQTLILAARRARDLGVTFSLTRPSEPVRKLLALTALDDYFAAR